jgi:hypothetical protein
MPGNTFSDTLVIRLGRDTVLPLLQWLKAYGWRFNVTLQDYVSEQGNMPLMTEASGSMTTQAWLTTVKDWMNVSSANVTVSWHTLTNTSRKRLHGGKC